MINGGCKFFDKNYALYKYDTSISATSNNNIAKAMIDISRYTRWESFGSNDITTEIITLSFNVAKTIDRIALLLMNFKDFNIKYSDGAVFVDFSNVKGVNNISYSGINVTDYENDTAYFEFDEVTTQQIQISCNKTQIANAEKYLTLLVTTLELGTLEGFPRIQPESKRNEIKAVVLSKRLLVQKTYETNKVRITFKQHPYQQDLDLIKSLFDREEPFLVYPCGGRFGSQYFKVNMHNWKISDMYNMQLTGTIKNEFQKGVYLLGFNTTITLQEHV